MLLKASSSVVPFFLLTLFLCTGSIFADEEEAPPTYKLDVVLLARNLGNPIDLFSIPGDTSGRRFILEQDGRVLIMEANNEVDRLYPFLNMQDRTLALQYPFDERGMIGVVFHPNYLQNGKLYARYTTTRKMDNICYNEEGEIPTDLTAGCPDQHSSILSEFTVALDTSPNRVDPATEKILMEVENPSGKNIGAGLAFGPDGYLYTGFGDGGGIYGPGNGDGSGYADASEGVSPALYFFDLWSQNLTIPHGKVHRIDVDTITIGQNYSIPASNPWVGNTKGYLETIYAWGFRNPYRLSFDSLFYRPGVEEPLNGHYPFWISSSSETLFDATTRVDEPGNYGWAVMQGSHCFSRINPLVPPDTVSCTTNEDCASVVVYNQQPLCVSGKCSCNMTDAEGYQMKPPAIEYVNNNAAERDTAEELVEAGLIGKPQGRASLGGSIYRGTEINWLIGKFVNGDFAIDQLNGQIQIATEPEDRSLPWPLEIGFVFDPSVESKAGFMKAIGEDANGELYAITGEFDEFFQIDGRVYKIIDASITADVPATTTDEPEAIPMTPPTTPVAPPPVAAAPPAPTPVAAAPPVPTAAATSDVGKIAMIWLGAFLLAVPLLN